MLIDEAATAPVSSDGPTALTHSPTAKPDLSAATSLLNVVVWVVVTERVAFEAPTCRTKPPPPMEMIFPEAVERRFRPAPEGRFGVLDGAAPP